jgi:hypothetical protein
MGENDSYYFYTIIHLQYRRGGFILMVISLLTFIYIMIFEIFDIDLRLYTALFIILIAAYRASKNLKISVFNILDFYPMKITTSRIIEFLSSVMFFLYFYIKILIIPKNP